MTGEDRDVLEFLGQKGKSPEEIGERFPGFNMLRLVRAGLVEEKHIELAETLRRDARVGVARAPDKRDHLHPGTPLARRVQVADWEDASRRQDWFNADGLHCRWTRRGRTAGSAWPDRVLCGSACQTAIPPTAQPPRNVRLQSLRGTPVVGRLLTCRPGAWARTRPIVFSYRWLRRGKVLAGVLGPTRRLSARDSGRLVACVVWAGNADGATPATSKALLVRAAP